jgi:hypothetical protein
MPKPKDPNGGREERERRERGEHGRPAHEHRHEDEQDRPTDAERPRRRRMGRDHVVHQQVVNSRLSGGAPATPEAYAEGLKEWQQLPGSIVRPASDEKPSDKPAPQVKDNKQKED